MKSLKRNLISVVDIGSTKVVCFIAAIEPDGNANVLGIGHQVARGIKSGSITDITLAEKSIRLAVGAAEQMAGVNIANLIVSISGRHNSCHIVNCEMDISGQEVSKRDLNRLTSKGARPYSTDKDEVIHCIASDYAIDEISEIKNPIGMKGDKLSANLCVITAPTANIFNIAGCLAKCHLDTKGYIAAPYAAAVACLSEDEKELGSIVIDFGGGSTSMAIFKNGNLVYMNKIAIGGNHITNDLAIGLSTNIENAERTKTLYGSVFANVKDEQMIIDVMQFSENGEQELIHIPKSEITEIIRPRAEEIVEMLQDILNKSPYKNFSGHVIITGGASQLSGLKELISEKLQRQVRIGQPVQIEGLAESTKGPAFSVCAGMLSLASQKIGYQNDNNFLANIPANSTLGKIISWLKENF